MPTTNDEVPVHAIGRICFVRWSARPVESEVRAIAEAILRVRRAVGQPLMIVALFPPDATVPDASGRAAFTHYSPLVDRACECQYAVIGGVTVGRKLLRGSLTAIAAVMRIPAEILEDAETAVTHACARLGIEPGPVLAEARARGLIGLPDGPHEA